MPKPSQRVLLLIFLLSFLSLLVLGEVSLAQIVRDGTVGPAVGSVVEPSGPNYQIDSRLGRIEGANLFHSFSDFNVQTLADGTIESATFTNSLSDPIQNILSRVTGDSPSTINGTLASTIENANLFLLNPSGVMFGPNASLDLKGSFHVSTADVLRFDRQAFYMDASLDGNMDSVIKMPPLTDFGFFGDPNAQIGNPTAFGFSGENPKGTTLDARILIDRSTLVVEPEQVLSVIGRDAQVGTELKNGVEFHGVESFEQESFALPERPGGGRLPILSAPGGRVNVASVGHKQEGAVLFNEDLKFVSAAGSQPLGNISFSELLGIAVGEFSLVPRSAGVLPGAPPGAMSVVIRGGKLEIKNSYIASETNSNDGLAGTGTGPIVLTVNNILIDRGGSIAARGIGGLAPGGNPGGEVIISTENLVMMGDESKIETYTTGSEDETSAGNITIQGLDGERTFAKKVSLISDGSIVIDSSTRFNAPAGAISISADEIELLRNPNLSSGSGASSSIRTIVDEEVRFYNEAFVEPGGPSGDITIQAQTLTLDGDSSIESGVRQESSGDAGDINLNVDNLVLKERARIASGTSFLSSLGDGGTITIQGLNNPAANEISIVGLMELDGAPLSPLGIFSNTQSSGKAGDIILSAERLNIAGGVNGASISTSSGIELDTESIECFVCSTERTLGDAGTITLNVNQLEANRATVSSRSDDNNGVARFRIEDFDIINGEVVTSLVGFQEIPLFGGKAGSITIQGAAGAGMPVEKIALNKSTLNTIVDSDLGEGNLPSGLGGAGGLRKGPSNISVTAKEISLNNGTTIFADTTGEAPAGNIVLNVDTLTAEDSIIASTSSLSTSNSTSLAGDIMIQGIALSSAQKEDNGKSIPLANTIRIENSIVSTNSMSTTGGNITLSADFLIHVIDSQIRSEIASGESGGNIDLDPQFIILQGTPPPGSPTNAILSTRATQFGNGGDITLGNARTISFIDQSRPRNQVIDVRSGGGGIPGTVNDPGTTANLSEEVPRPDVAIVDPQSFLPVRCASQQGGTFSSIVEDGLDALPPEPGDFFPSQLPVFEETARSAPSVSQSSISLEAFPFGLSATQEGSDLSSQIALASSLSGCAL